MHCETLQSTYEVHNSQAEENCAQHQKHLQYKQTITKVPVKQIRINYKRRYLFVIKLAPRFDHK